MLCKLSIEECAEWTWLASKGSSIYTGWQKRESLVVFVFCFFVVCVFWKILHCGWNPDCKKHPDAFKPSIGEPLSWAGTHPHFTYVCDLKSYAELECSSAWLLWLQVATLVQSKCGPSSKSRSVAEILLQELLSAGDEGGNRYPLS